MFPFNNPHFRGGYTGSTNWRGGGRGRGYPGRRSVPPVSASSSFIPIQDLAQPSTSQDPQPSTSRAGWGAPPGTSQFASQNPGGNATTSREPAAPTSGGIRIRPGFPASSLTAPEFYPRGYMEYYVHDQAIPVVNMRPVQDDIAYAGWLPWDFDPSRPPPVHPIKKPHPFRPTKTNLEMCKAHHDTNVHFHVLRRDSSRYKPTVTSRIKLGYSTKNITMSPMMRLDATKGHIRYVSLCRDNECPATTWIKVSLEEYIGFQHGLTYCPEVPEPKENGHCSRCNLLWLDYIVKYNTLIKSIMQDIASRKTSPPSDNKTENDDKTAEQEEIPEVSANDNLGYVVPKWRTLPQSTAVQQPISATESNIQPSEITRPQTCFPDLPNNHNIRPNQPLCVATNGRFYMYARPRTTQSFVWVRRDEPPTNQQRNAPQPIQVQSVTSIVEHERVLHQNCFYKYI